MKPSSFCGFALLATAALFTHGAFATKPPPPPPPPPPSSGTLVLSYQHPGGSFAEGYGITVAPSGHVYVSGWADVNRNLQWNGIVLGSDDAGESWWLLDDYGSSGYFYYGGVITSDAAGKLYASYMQWDQFANSDHWITRRSTDGGVTWTTVDDFNRGGGTTTGIDYVYGIAASPAGDIFVAGESAPNATAWPNNWTIRRGVGGASFSTVDVFAGGTVQAVFVHPATGAIFAAGSAPVTISGKKATAWIVRRSTDGGVTWSTVDTHLRMNVAGSYNVAAGIGADSTGSIYVVGNGGNYWTVRKSANGGNSFSTVDQIASSSSATGFATSSAGDLYVIGNIGGKNYLRKSAGGTGLWTNVDQMAFTPSAIAANRTGNVFVSGYGTGFITVKKY